MAADQGNKGGIRLKLKARRATLTAILILSGAALTAQAYFPFPSDKASWTVYAEFGSYNTAPDTFLLRLFLHGDTLLGDLAYSKVWAATGNTLHSRPELHGLPDHITMVLTCCHAYWEFICYYDEDVEFINPAFESCFPEYLVSGTGNMIPDPPAWNLYPDPTGSGNVLEGLRAGGSYDLRMYNSLGRQVYSQSLRPERKT